MFDNNVMDFEVSNSVNVELEINMAYYQDDVDEETESYTESEEEVDSESEQASQAQDSNAG